MELDGYEKNTKRRGRYFAIWEREGHSDGGGERGADGKNKWECIKINSTSGCLGWLGDGTGKGWGV